MESYVAHIRGLLEERECLTADYERDNEHLRHELHQIRQQQGESFIFICHECSKTLLGYIKAKFSELEMYLCSC